MSTILGTRATQVGVQLRHLKQSAIRSLFIFFCAVLFLTPRTARATYTITDLGILSGFDATVPTGINSSGTVVGYCYVAGSPTSTRAFVWKPSTSNGTSGTMTDLSSILGTHVSAAYAVNNSGYICGYYSAFIAGGKGGGTYYQHAFVLQPSGGSYTLIDLTGTASTSTGAAFAINNVTTTHGGAGSGKVVGRQGGTAVLWPDQTNGVSATILVPATGMLSPITGEAHGIDDNNVIVGWSDDPAYNTGPESGFTWASSSYSWFSPNQWSTPDEYRSEALAIASGGSNQVVGMIHLFSTSRIYAENWPNTLTGSGILTDTIYNNSDWGGILDSTAFAVNNNGIAVGTCCTDSMSSWIYPGEYHAFKWTSGTPINLNTYITSSWQVFTSATGINDYTNNSVIGQIVGYGRKSNGDVRAFLLTP